MGHAYHFNSLHFPVGNCGVGILLSYLFSYHIKDKEGYMQPPYSGDQSHWLHQSRQRTLMPGRAEFSASRFRTNIEAQNPRDMTGETGTLGYKAPEWSLSPVDSTKALAKARRSSRPKRDDDHDGHYVFNLGENLTPRYKILSKMGKFSAKIASVVGTFGRVLECWDRQTRYRVQIRNWFDIRNHICIVFEKLGPSLFDFLKRNKYSPFPVDLVREFVHQLLESVAYMHDLLLINTDLKPENILLVSSEYVKLPGCKVGVILLIFGVGCILIELCTGGALFQTHENLEHLAMMEMVLGPLPEHMIRRARGSEKYFGAALD
ncbi:hypothetical protein GOBAR_DD11960 [Gossypium barbadense]|nr:hypothetical protein GOBAR_DD11960 [Gossypium barbadense]